jgi:hypothetical protein
MRAENLQWGHWLQFPSTICRPVAMQNCKPQPTLQPHKTIQFAYMQTGITDR